MEKFWSKVKKSRGCWEWISATGTHGYGRLSIKRKDALAHRVSWEISFGPIPSGKFILHACDNRKCVKPSHLFLGDRTSNMADKVKKNRQAKGEIIHKILSKSDVLRIRVLYRNGDISQVRLSKMFKIHQTSISKIVNRKSWGWL
jgi:hypothetical protein